MPTPRIVYDPHRRGTRFFETIYLKDSAGAAKNITGYAFSCKGRAFTGATTELVTLTVAVVDAVGGQITVEITASNTLLAALDHVPTLECGLNSTDASGNLDEEATLVIPLLDVLTS